MPEASAWERMTDLSWKAWHHRHLLARITALISSKTDSLGGTSPDSHDICQKLSHSTDLYLDRIASFHSHERANEGTTMQLVVIEDVLHPQSAPLLQSMLDLRSKVFAERLNWKVETLDGQERDDFDDQAPTYILLVEGSHRVVGSVRLHRAARSSMLVQVFPMLLEGGKLRVHAKMIESSRFCIDKDLPQPPHGSAPHRPDARSAQASFSSLRTRTLLAGIVDWCLANGFHELVTATDVRFERILRMAGWPMCRLGPATFINETDSVAGSLEISKAVFERLRPEGYSPFVTLATQKRASS